MSETAAGRQQQAPHEPPAIIDVTEDDFESAVVAASHARPVLVDIGADWCGPCRVLGPRLHALAQARGGEFLLANVDADENMRIAGRHKVRGFPHRHRLQPRGRGRPLPFGADRWLPAPLCR
jgi:thioredoxin-like negative regulator of GroEL